MFYTIGMTPGDARLTEDMIKKINQAVEAVSHAGYGEVVIKVEKGVPRWVVQSTSCPLIPGPAPTRS